MNKKKVKLILVPIVTVSLLGILILSEVRKVNVGVQAVNYMYNYKTLDILAENQDKLKSITTEEMYKKLSPTSVDKVLSTYLKFKKSSVEVEVIKNNKGYVYYTLHTDSLSSGRNFIFIYETDWLGRINYAIEMEGAIFNE